MRICIVECEVYDKKHKKTYDTHGREYNNYYIKITDGNYIVDQWIEISKENYEKDGNNIRFYAFDQAESIFF